MLESRSRHRIGRAGLPAPLTPTDLFDVSGNFVARVDFSWPRYGVVGEADGLGRHEREPFDPMARRLRNALAAGQIQPGQRRWRLASGLAA